MAGMARIDDFRGIGIGIRTLSGQSAVFAEFFPHKQEAFNTLSRLLSVFELNNIDISIPSSLGERVRNLCQQDFVIYPILR
jgi:hypothetical protein